MGGGRGANFAHLHRGPNTATRNRSANSNTVLKKKKTKHLVFLTGEIATAMYGPVSSLKSTLNPIND